MKSYGLKKIMVRTPVEEPMGEGRGFLSNGVPVRTSQWPMDDFIPCVSVSIVKERLPKHP